jgi:hypothetical protein
MNPAPPVTRMFIKNDGMIRRKGSLSRAGGNLNYVFAYGLLPRTRADAGGAVNFPVSSALLGGRLAMN